MIFLDHDDIWEADCLETLIAVANTTPNSIGSFGIARYIDSTGTPIKIGELEAMLMDRLVYRNGKICQMSATDHQVLIRL